MHVILSSPGCLLGLHRAKPRHPALGPGHGGEAGGGGRGGPGGRLQLHLQPALQRGLAREPRHGAAPRAG